MSISNLVWLGIAVCLVAFLVWSLWLELWPKRTHVEPLKYPKCWCQGCDGIKPVENMGWQFGLYWCWGCRYRSAVPSRQLELMKDPGSVVEAHADRIVKRYSPEPAGRVQKAHAHLQQQIANHPAVLNLVINEAAVIKRYADDPSVSIPEWVREWYYT